MKTSVTELPESRVRVEAEVPPEEVERSLATTAGRLGRDLRIPGFRKGKVPPPVVIRRLGREAVLDEAVRASLGRWYADALGEARIHPVGDPELNLDDLPGEGQPLQFSIEIGVRPKAQLGEYKGVEVGRREPEPGEEAVEAELQALRERLARLETVERKAENGDFVVMDYRGSVDGEPFEGGEGRDQMIELGSGRLIPGFEEQLTGLSAGEEATVEVTFPPDYPAEHLAGKDAVFAITVKEVKEKRLPELDDDFAVEAAGADTLDELRDDVARRLTDNEERRVEAEFREAVLDAVVAESTVEVPEALVEARARELWERTLHSLSHQGISREAYLQISGRTEEEVLEEAKPDAEQALKREAVLAAVVQAEGIRPTDDELVHAIAESGEQGKAKPEKILKQLRKSGRIEDLREDLAARRALDVLVEHAQAISVEQAKARDKLWTPGREDAERGGGELWTPGS